MTSYTDIVNILAKGANGTSVNDYASMILADKLCDDNDPREIIVRRDLGYREDDSDDNWYYNRDRHSEDLGGDPLIRHYLTNNRHVLDDGSIVLYRVSGPEIYYIGWRVRNIFYGAILTAVECKTLETKLHGSGLLKAELKLL